MELTYKDYKRINNTGNLPKFEDGLNARQQQNIQDIGNAFSNWGLHNLETYNPSNNIKWSYNQNEQVSPHTMIINQGGFTNSAKNAIGQGGNSTGGAQYSSADAAASGAGPWFALGSWLGGGVMEGLGMAKTSDQLIAESGTSQRNSGGIGYTRQNVVNAGQIMSDYDKQSLSKWLTNPATALTSLLNRGSAKKAAQLAQQKSYNLGQEQWGGAYTKALRLNNAKEYGNSTTQMLFAKNGKMPHCDSGRFPARISNGEVLVEPGVMTREGEGKDSKDTLVRDLAPETAVFPNKGKKKFGIDISDYVWNTGDVDGGLMMLNEYQLDKKIDEMKAKNGKMPKFAEGYWSNAVPGIVGAAASLDQILQAAINKPYKPKSYVSNPYESEALSTLAGLGINPYPITQQLRSAATQANRSIDRSDGLGVGQRPLSRLAVLNTTQNNISNALSSIQQQNNSYLSDYAKTTLQAGANNAKMKMAADQYDLDYYSKAHAARQQGIQTGIYNMLNNLQQYYANDFKRRQFNDMMGLYKQQLSLDQQRLLHDLYDNGSSFAKNMENYTRNQKNQYLINRVATNPAFDPTKALTYRNLTGKYLSSDKYLKIDPNGIRIR